MKSKFKIFFWFLLLFFFNMSIVMVRPLKNLDEIWNFNYAVHIANNLIPYKDFNMITTPLLPMICQIFLRIFGKKLIVMRFLASIMWTAMFYMCYLIFNTLFNGKQRNTSFLLTLIINFCYINVIFIDYNLAVLLICLIILYLELKELNISNNNLSSNFFKNFIIGLLAGIAILFKQTTGLAISIACVFYKFICIKSKKEIPVVFKSSLARLMGVLLPCFILIIYLACNGAFADFVDYTILGVSTFSNKITYFEFIKYNGSMRLLAIIVPLTLLFMIGEYFKTRDNRMLIILVYALSSFVVVYPIFDSYHFLAGAMITLIYIFYYFCINLTNILKKFKKRIINIKLIILTVNAIIFLLTIINLVTWNSYRSKSNNVYAYKNIIVENLLIESINSVDKYIMDEKKHGKKVYILDSHAAVYMIPLGFCNKDYDLFLIGNLGYKSEDGIIEEIKKNKNMIYLIIEEEEYRNRQTPEKVISYVEKNLTKTGEISGFAIYESN